ncbi:signal peptidase complex subunit 2-like [Cornus florida]|uniref:signal peptidase complex subunit 2-like n=1 Tax=Cornus florida TaxID=4283 RepID=UPI002897FA14|nr:signal peptidase complex subunit 2-like [Cornus florida]
MQEMKDDMATKNPKETNLLDHHSIKRVLDESVTEIAASRGYVKDARVSNVRLLMGTIIIIIALVAQFYQKKFPENRNFLIGCIILYPTRLIISVLIFGLISIILYFIAMYLIFDSGKYIVFNGLLQLIIYTKGKNAILFTYPPAVSYSVPFNWFNSSLISCEFFLQESFDGTGLMVSSKLPRCCDMYTLTITSADPKSISTKEPVEFTKSVTKWFTKDGVLVEGLFWKDVAGLINDYAREYKKS